MISVSWQAAAAGPTTVRLRTAAGEVHHQVQAHAGANSAWVPVPEPTGHDLIRVQLYAGPSAEGPAAEAALGPVRPWRIFLVHHTHLDIGYTDVQSHVLHLHLGFLDEAVEFCARTRDWPEDSRFRWNVETTYPLGLWCRRRGGAAVRRLVRCLADGQMEIGAFPLNMHAETCSYEELVQGFAEGQALARSLGVRLRSAMHSDVPGLPWTVAQLLADSGVRYLSLAPNNHRAPVHQRRAFDRPFWWRTPDGKRLLTWFTDDPRHAYQEGNHLGFMESYEAVCQHLPGKLVGLEAAGYPYDALHLRCQGAYADNGPPNLRVAEVARRWNEEWLWPRVRVACNSDFFSYVEQRWGGAIPEHGGDWPDWWADGTGSAAREMSLVRQAHALAAVAGAAAALAGEVPTAVREDLRAADREMLLFDEHTWGAALPEQNTLRNFGSQGRQWSFKSAFAHRAEAHAGLAADSALLHLAGRLRTGELPAVFVFNATAGPRRAPVTVELPRWVGAEEGRGLVLLDPTSGQQVPFEWIPAGLHDRPALHFVTPEVPALGYRRLDVLVGEGPVAGEQRRQAGPAATAIQNRWLDVGLDQERGGIGSLMERSRDRQLVDRASPWGLGTFVSERYQKQDPFELRDLLVSRRAGAPLELGASSHSRIDQTLAWRWPGAEDADAVSGTIRLYDDLPGLYLENVVAKRAAPHTEGLYFAFPFALEGLDGIHYDLPGGSCRLGEEQLPGSLTDWSVVSSGVWLEGAEASILWGTVDACLLQFGTIRTAMSPTLPEKPGHLYSYIANNLWTTNFVARQQGDLRFRYVIQAAGALTARGFGAFGQGVQQPLLATVVPAGQDGQLHGATGDLLHVSGPGVLVESLRSDGTGGLLVRLRECGGEAVVAEIGVPVGCAEAELVNPAGEPLRGLTLADGVVRVALGPRALVHVRLGGPQ